MSREKGVPHSISDFERLGDKLVKTAKLMAFGFHDKCVISVFQRFVGGKLVRLALKDCHSPLFI